MEGTKRLLGKVKWFNYQNGYGFITPLEPLEGGQDVFVHHTSISVNESQYRYLIEGEYVEYTLENVNSREHTFHAVDITGIKRNTLMCETKNNGLRQKPRGAPPPMQRTSSVAIPSMQRTSSVSIPSLQRESSVSMQRTSSVSTDDFEFPKQKRIQKK